MKLHTAEHAKVAKQILAQMEIEDKRLEEEVEEEGHQQLFHPSGQRGTGGVNPDKEFEGLDEVDYSEGEDEDESEPEKEVNTYQGISGQCLPSTQVKGKGKGQKKT